ncbi:MAG: carbohydrate ABC transporter permease [Candidatus Hydrothermarchaeales archaeon]
MMQVRLKRKRSKITDQLVAYLILSGGLTIIIFPYIWMVIASFKPSGEIFTRFIPTRLTLDHYRFLLKTSAAFDWPFGRALFNSFLVAGIDTLSVVFFGSMAGYALARLRFRGREPLYNFVLYQMLFPYTMFVIPLFVLIHKLGFVNTYQGMFLPFMLSAWSIFFYAQFFRTIPQEMIDAARIDGCSELGIVFRIMVPLASSITIVVALFTFMERWDEFLWNLIVVKERTKTPLPVLLALFTRGAYMSYYGPQMAGATILTVPIVTLFLFARRFFVKGIIMTGLKR